MRQAGDIVKEWMEGVQGDLIAGYDRHGLRASGSFAKSLEPVITERPHGYNLKMKAARHSYFMENGRRPNAEKSPAAAKRLYPIIKQWVQDKGLPFDNRRVFAICLKIVYKGIRVPNKYNPGGVISEVVTEQRMRQLARSLGRNILLEFQSFVIKDLKQ